MKYFKKKYFFAFILVLVLGLLFNHTNEIGQLMYPIKYKEDIQLSAENHDIDPLLIAAVIRVESNYRPMLESPKKAQGLMQIMPDTADWIISQNAYSIEVKEYIYEPDINIEMGTWYIRWINQKFEDKLTDDMQVDDQVAMMAAAYNAGHNKLSKWFEEGVWDGTYENLSQVPFGETRHYIKRVIYYYKKYHSFYSDDLVDK